VLSAAGTAHQALLLQRRPPLPPMAMSPGVWLASGRSQPTAGFRPMMMMIDQSSFRPPLATRFALFSTKSIHFFLCTPHQEALDESNARLRLFLHHLM
jgi:hypothetical protein